MIRAAKRLLASPHVWIAAGIFATLAAIGHLVSFNAMSALARAWQLWISVAVLVAYGRRSERRAWRKISSSRSASARRSSSRS